MRLIDRLVLCNQLAIMRALERIALPIHCEADRKIIDELGNQVECTKAVLREAAENDS